MAEGIVFGTESEFGGAIVNRYDLYSVALDDSSFVVVYRDYDDSGHGTAKIGTVSGTTITFGAESEFLDSGDAEKVSVARISPTKFVVAYKDGSDSDHGKVKIGTVSGTNITFGAETEYSSSDETNFLSVTSLTTSGFIIAFNGPPAGYHGKALFGTVSGTTITFGAESEFLSVFGAWVIDTETVSPTKFIVTYQDRNDSDHGKAKIGTVSGTTITFGAESEFLAGEAAYIYTRMIDDSRFVVVYYDGSDSGHGTAKIGTVSGTTITFGSESEFLSSGQAYKVSVDVFSDDKFIVSYRDEDDLGYGTVKIGTVSGTNITFGIYEQFLTSGSPTATYVRTFDASKFVIVYGDGGDSNYGTSKIGIFYNDIIISGDLFLHGYSLITISDNLFIEGLLVSDASLSGVPLRIINRLTRMSDYDPQLVGAFSNSPSSVNIEVWDITDGQNIKLTIASSGCYQMGNSDGWGWSTQYLLLAPEARKYHYYFKMISDTSEEQFGEFFITVPEHGLWSYPN